MKKLLVHSSLFIVISLLLLLNQNTSPYTVRYMAAGMNDSYKNFPEGILRSLLRSSSLLPTVYAQSPSTNSPEEGAVYNLNQGLLPSEIIKDAPSEDQNILQKLLSFLGNLKDRLLFQEEPSNKVKLYTQSQSIHQAQTPPELKPLQDSPIEKLKNFLGGSGGFYGLSLPQFQEQKEVSIQQSEKLYEKANFPEGIKPITGQ